MTPPLFVVIALLILLGFELYARVLEAHHEADDSDYGGWW